MHELAIIEETFRVILKIADENLLERINKVTMEIGEYRQVDPSVFRFAFDAAKEGTIASGALLEIECQPLEMKCAGCNNIFSVRKSHYKCPRCGDRRLQAVKGMEIFIKTIEGE
jgi:hydrogenase nickel incorporation protein HypA/HybF